MLPGLIIVAGALFLYSLATTPQPRWSQQALDALCEVGQCSSNLSKTGWPTYTCWV